jgi:hypothetical protein
MKKVNFTIFTTVLFFSMPQLIFAQLQPPPPALGTAESFAVFTSAGLLSNNGTTLVNGDVGSNVGGVMGFPPGIVNGSIHDADGTSATAATDVCNAYAYLAGINGGTTIGTTLGNGQTLTPNVYTMGAAATLNGNLTLDAEDNPNAIFIFQIDGAFASTVGSTVTLINGASPCNVYWQTSGAVTLGDFSVFEGAILSNGAIDILESATLFGRALTCAGAISLHNNMITNILSTVSTVTANGATTFCVGGSVMLSGNMNGTWSTGETTESIVVTTSGDYFVTNTDGCGLEISNTITVTVNPLPLCAISGELSFCDGQSTELCTPFVLGNTYEWSTGETSNCITVDQAGLYSVTVTSADGCISVCSETVNVSPEPVCTITGGLSFCDGQSTELCTPFVLGNTYEWSTGETSNCITVDQAGLYSVTVTSADGCISVCSETVNVSPEPVCTITGGLSFCDGQSTELCTPFVLGNTYEWSTGETSNCITVDQAGLYSVTVTSADGCISVCSETVNVSPEPVCTITGGLSFCDGQSTELCTPFVLGNTYEWSTGETSNCITVDQAGLYSVTVTSADGCISVCSETVNVSPEPVCTITGGLSLCDGQSTELCTPLVPGNTYEWSTGETSNCITVDQAGLYSVTVTSADGCISVCSETVNVSPEPVCTITGGLSFCDGQSTELCTPFVLGNTYEWSTGETSNCITVDQAGLYSVTVTSADGCISVCSETVNVSPEPVCTITGGLSFCDGQSTELCTPFVLGNTYEWSTGETSNCITVDQAGLYSVTVTSADGCISVCSETVNVSPEPVCMITGGLSFCDGQSTELCTPFVLGNTYEWSTGETSNCITVDQAGLYSVTVTSADGCISVCSETVNVSPEPVCTITGGLSFCDGQSTELCTPFVLGNTYEWSTGETSNCITVDQAGLYSVTVTSADGCISVCSETVNVSPEPVCTITGGLSFCDGQSTELCTPFVPGNTYEWSTGETSNCITVDQAGLYSVTVTSADGCISVCSETVNVSPEPVCTITGGLSFCDGQSTELCTPFVLGNTYEWSTGETSNCITVDQAGLYSVTVTSADGCISICSETVNVSPEPVCTITGGLSLCDGESTELCTPFVLGNTYEWSTGETSNCITVDQPGLYSVTVTSADGCISICSETVNVSPEPLCTITGGLSFCDGQSTELCTPLVPGNTYEWSTGETSNCITVDQPGQYSVTVTSIDGCISICSETVNVSPEPLCTITGGLSFCDGQSTELCTPFVLGNTYEWSTGETSNCITVDQAGLYSVTVTSADGCISICSETVNVSPEPVCTITGGLSLCDGESTELCTPFVLGNTYEWSTGETSNCITVDQPGLYSVTVTSADGCISICSETVNVSPEPLCTITGGLSFCDGQSTELCTPLVPGNTYEWSTGETSNCITVDQPGQYSVTVTSIDGCISICSETVNVSPEPLCTITGGLSFCDGQSTELCTPFVPGNTYEWSTGETSNCITVDQPGQYSVTVTSIDGCISICSETVNVSPEPLCTITGGLSLCDGQSTELCTPLVPGNTYEWSTGETSNCITVDQPGLYSVTVTSADGCISVCSETVNVSPEPLCTITGGLSLCDGQSTELCTPLVPGNTYEWSTGETSNCITVDQPGLYSVTVTSADGCISICSETVNVSPEPLCTITGGLSFCDGQSTELCTPFVPGNTYEWSTGETSNCITVDQPGQYSVTVTSIDGCISICSETVNVSPEPVCTITGGLSFCDGESTELCTPFVLGNTYEWSTGETSNCITVDQPGLYSVTVTSIDGCISICSETVNVSPEPLCTITGGLSLCDGQSTELCTPLVPGNTYEWSTGETSNCITVDQPGLYSVTVTSADGCISICSETVTVNPLPLCTITGPDLECGEDSVKICASPGASSYLWNTGATTTCITVTLPGTYSVTVTDVDGCSSVCSHLVIANTEPPPIITCPSGLTIECDESTLPDNTGIATAPVYCNITPVISYVDEVTAGACPEEFTIIRTWTAAYDSEISVICTQVINVQDITPPSIVCPPDLIIQCDESTLPANTGMATATDNCGISPQVTYSDVFLVGDCEMGSTITRTWQAMDECGNSATCVQVITILDNTGPVITIVNPLLAANGETTYVQCYGQDPDWARPLFDENSVEAEDLCGDDVTITYSQVLESEGDCEEDGYIVRYRLTWTATDICGNSSSVFVFYELVDTIAPVIHGVPDDITVNCDEIPPMPELVYATDECLCACVMVVEELALPNGCLNGQVLLRTWTAFDDCGNKTVATQRITIIDDQGPVISVIQPEIAGVPDGMILEYTCSEGGLPDFLNEMDEQAVAAGGVCGSSAIVSFSLINIAEEAPDCEVDGFIEELTYQWTAVDECGISSTLTLTVRLIDDEAPVLVGVPAFMTCFDDPALLDIHAIDDCGEAYLRFTEVEVPNPCGIGTVIQRTYLATDDCGNSTSASVLLVADDLIAPVLEFVDTTMNAYRDGDFMTINCATSGGPYTAFSASDMVITDACSEGAVVSFTERLISTGDCEVSGIVAVIELKWTATGFCGNTTERIVMAQVMDNANPVFVDFQPMVTVGCNAAMPLITVIDDCGDVVVTSQDSIVAGACEFEYIVYREITATDPCGNVTIRQQTVRVGDGSGPTIIGVEAEDICDDLTIPSVTAYDACADEFVDVTMVQDTLNVPCLDGLSIRRTWTAVNSCGRATVVVQNIVVNDDTPPVITPLAPVINRILYEGQQLIFLSEQELVEALNALDEYSVLVTDECNQGIVPVLTIEVQPGSCEEDGYSERRVYTWVATDACGNTASLSFSVDLIDDVPPVIQHLIPADTKIICEDLPPGAVLPLNPLDEIVIVYTEVITAGGSPEEFLVTRTWVATDSCGNETVGVQQITWIPDTYLVCEVLAPLLVTCNSHGVVIGSTVTGGFGDYTYDWEVVGEKCFIQGGQGTPELSIYIGWGPVKVILNVTDEFGCVSMCMVVFDCDLSQLQFFDTPVFGSPEQAADPFTLNLNLDEKTDAGEYLSELKLWPNPTTGTVSLSFESDLAHEVQFTLMNVLGQVVREEPFTAIDGLNTHQMELGHLAPGRYLIQMRTGQEIHAKAIVVLPN